MKIEQLIRRQRTQPGAHLADKLNMVRQTISKREQGLSVPDPDLNRALPARLPLPWRHTGGRVSDSEKGITR